MCSVHASLPQARVFEQVLRVELSGFVMVQNLGRDDAVSSCDVSL